MSTTKTSTMTKTRNTAKTSTPQATVATATPEAQAAATTPREAKAPAYNPNQTNRVVSAAISKNGFIRVYCFDKTAKVAVQQYHFAMDNAKKALACAFAFSRKFHAPILKRGMDFLLQCQPIPELDEALRLQKEFNTAPKA